MKHLLIFLASTTPLFAESRDFDPLTDSAATLGFLSAEGAELGSSDIDWSQHSFRSPLTPSGVELSERTRLFAELRYVGTRFDIGGAALAATPDDDLTKIAVPLTAFYSRENSDWTYYGQFTPELSSDLNHINGDDFGFSGRLGVQYKFSDELNINFGASYTQDFGDPRAFPLLGFEWRPSSDFAVTLRGPRLTASYRATSDIIFRAGGFATGGYWNIETATGDVQFGLQSYNAGLGVDYQITEKIWLTFWGGTTLANEIRIETTSGSRIQESDLDGGWFGYIGLRIYEW